MVICGSYIFEISVNKDRKNKTTMIKGELQHIFLESNLILIVKESKISVEHGKVVTTPNIIKHEIYFLVYKFWN